MTEASVTVRLRFWTGVPDMEPDESEAVAAFSTRTDLLAAMDDQQGTLIIEYGEDRIQIGDELSALVPSLCVDGVRTVLTDGHVTVEQFAYFGNIVLQRDGVEIVVSGSRIPPTRLPARALLVGLVDCARRYADLMAKLWTGDADLDRKLRALRGGCDSVAGELAAAFPAG